MDALDEMAARIEHHSRGYLTDTPVPRVTLVTADDLHGPVPEKYFPVLCLVAAGTKRTVLGEHVLDYGRGDFVVSALDVPVTGWITKVPYRALAIRLQPELLAQFILDTPRGKGPSGCGLALANATPPLLQAFLRMAQLLDAPEDIPALAELIEREILYRVLKGPAGNTLRQAGIESGPLARIGPVIARIRANPGEPMSIDALADMASMSVSTLLRHFKAVTAMTPLQFQKQLRLQEARRLLSTGGVSATSVAGVTGYKSASQFNREYKQTFGEPPMRDAAARSDPCGR